MRSFSKKLDLLFWWLIWLLPLLTAFICLAFGSDSVITDFTGIINTFRFGFIGDLFGSLEDLVNFEFPAVLVSYISYLVSVEILHVLVDVLLFLPRFAHDIIDRDNYNFGGKKL